MNTTDTKSSFRKRLQIWRRFYTQVTSRCRIQSVVIDSRARKTTQCNSQLFPSCLTQQSGQ
ncbi:hypothetical protein F0242_04380 [Vibrio rotiferianus]|nr:hypothetical protein [Vibrio rotiferianus]TMX39321.1 hypothetical protein DA095_10105 [Vibrio rotiferianus]